MAKNYFEASSGARSVKFYALSLKQIQEHEEALAQTNKVEQTGQGLVPQQFLKYLPAFTLSAQRGDTSITEEDVAAVVDMQNFSRVMRAAFGMADKIADDEAQSQVPMSPLTGGDSTRA